MSESKKKLSASGVFGDMEAAITRVVEGNKKEKFMEMRKKLAPDLDARDKQLKMDFDRKLRTALTGHQDGMRKMRDKLNAAFTSHKEEMRKMREGFEEQLQMASIGHKEEIRKMQEEMREMRQGFEERLRMSSIVHKEEKCKMQEEIRKMREGFEDRLIPGS